MTEEREFVVNIVNPIACTGTNNMKNEIFYGNDIGIESIGFDVTYIMHEAMHCLFPREKNWTGEQYGVCHSLIELAIDNGLRRRLGGSIGTYNMGHKDGSEIRKKLMPLWTTFLSSKGGMFSYDTIKFEEKEETEKYREQAQKAGVQNMNFLEFMKYCVEHYMEYGIDENTFLNRGDEKSSNGEREDFNSKKKENEEMGI